jgi:hypothetical protein
MSSRSSFVVAVIVVILALVLLGDVKSKAGTVQHQVSTPLCSYQDLAKAVGSSGLQEWRIVAVPTVQTSKGSCLVIIAEQ